MKKIIIVLSLAGITRFGYAQDKIRANPARMESRILELSEFGKNPQGGVSRVAFSEADVQGRTYIVRMMLQAGLVVKIDAAGNIIGKRAGKNWAAPAIAFGSHIDSVPMGGNYDGDVGVIGALECIALLNEARITTEHPLEVIVFTDEEGGLTGSRAMTGQIKASDLSLISQSGKSLGQGIQYIGGDTSKLSQAIRKNRDLMAFLELHIEQGARLYNTKTEIGVVEGIVGIEWWNVSFQGKANHAGTTPMAGRQDALLAASKFIIKVNEIAKSISGNQVATVGRITAEPGAPNVIPGRVVASLEIRDLSKEKIFSVFKQIESTAKILEKESSVAISFMPMHSNQPAVTDKRMQDIIAGTAKKLGMTFQYMPSGAGHDTQDLALIVPTGMIFVPSKDGISHAPSEFTSAEDMAKGASVLFHTILALDREVW